MKCLSKNAKNDQNCNIVTNQFKIMIINVLYMLQFFGIAYRKRTFGFTEFEGVQFLVATNMLDKELLILLLGV